MAYLEVLKPSRSLISLRNFERSWRRSFRFSTVAWSVLCIFCRVEVKVRHHCFLTCSGPSMELVVYMKKSRSDGGAQSNETREYRFSSSRKVKYEALWMMNLTKGVWMIWPTRERGTRR
ncbi:hypothetical protein EYF80_016394 [Liparis tanakae]|uniref:Uncharacterized protein n=1 Tax=Liparis tanakae TaxID=230148 RepID=A0A4Z2I6J7_9TELE|nr:hypothetical protein EYF80_016394 [Liparis tanakae]